MRKIRFCLLFVCIALIFGVPVLASSGGEIVSSYVEPAPTGYWTAERMKNAKSAMPMLEGAPEASTLEQAVGEPGISTSSADGSPSLVFTGDEAIALAVTGAIVPMADGYDTYPPPENTFPIPVTWYGSFPIRTVGKLYFTQGGFNYVCSGSSIGGKAILTAGHCVSDGNGTWNTNATFKPAHRPVWDAPYGTWTAYNFVTFTDWHSNGDFCKDVGFVCVNDISGNTLSQTVGWLGFAYNFSRIQHWSIFGYPAAAPWSGDIQVQTDSSYSNQDSTQCGVGNPDTTGTGWRQTGGASGGPWIMTYRPQQTGANNYANGVNSYIYTTPNEPNRIYSPYFDTAVNDLRTSVATTYCP